MASATPRLRAAPSPWFSVRTSFHVRCRATYASAIFAEPSVDPSSTMTTSSVPTVCAARLSRQAAR